MVDTKEIKFHHLSDELASDIQDKITIQTSASTSETTVLTVPMYSYYFEKPNLYSGGVDLTLFGELKNNTGSSVSLRMRFKFGTQTMIDTGDVTVPGDYGSGAYHLNLKVLGAGPTTVLCVLTFISARQGSTSVGKLFLSNQESNIIGVIRGAASANLKKNNDFSLTTQWSTNNSLIQFNISGYIIKKV